MKKVILAGMIAITAIGGYAVAGSRAGHFEGEQLLKTAKVSMAQAEAIALQARPGEIVKREAEKEDGSVRYSFDIKSDGTVYEVGVDANSGKVLENGAEDAAKEAAEAVEEAHEGHDKN